MREFETWRGIDVEATVPPSVRAEFISNEMRYPRFRLEVNVAVLRMLEDLVDRDLASCVNDGVEPSDELLALHEALEAIND